jgi:serine/tyrosine/threonine adenylyltransferase
MENGNARNEAGWNLDNSYAHLPKPFFSMLKAPPVSAPKLAVFNEPLADSLGLNAAALQSEEGVAVFAGNRVPNGAAPLAQAYAGHQFGHFNMLGDGRALLLGEQVTPKGERFDIQLKGSGRTPYSRGGDGRAALGPMLREYIMSEAMHSFGIPTTRSLAVVTTGESIFRETELPGAILTRVAASHIRVGTFQYAAARGVVQDLRALADYTIKRHYPELEGEENQYLALLQKVIKRQAGLIAKWQLVGFIHGVMNTDNMTLSGETIDYGPCAFMNAYDPATVFSSIDREGRYAYGNQPYIAGWNLARLAETLVPLLDEDEEKGIKLAQDSISEYGEVYQTKWLEGMKAKLGIFNEEADDETMIEELLTLMEKHQADFTNTFVTLTLNKQADNNLFNSGEFKKWYEGWQERLQRQEQSKDASHELMRKHNPALIPRNHRVEEALEAAVKEGDYSVMEKFLSAFANPYTHSPEQKEYASPPSPTARPYVTYCGT